MTKSRLSGLQTLLYNAYAAVWSFFEKVWNEFLVHFWLSANACGYANAVRRIRAATSQPEMSTLAAVTLVELTSDKQRSRWTESGGRVGRRRAVYVATDAFALRRVPVLVGERRNAFFLNDDGIVGLINESVKIVVSIYNCLIY